MFLSRLFPFRLAGKLFLFICFILFTSHVFAGSFNELNEKYEEIEDSILENIYGIPIHLESNGNKNTMRGDVYGIIYHTFKKVSQSLGSLTNWCEIMPQHLNVKACTYQVNNNQCRLTFYSGRKFYEKADDVYKLDYRFDVTSLNDTYFEASLNADEGPIDTKDYIISVEAIALSDSSTFFHLAYEYKFGFWTRFAMSTYFATLGSGKVGFTVIEKDEDGNPVYVEGIRGVIERNSIRYYFAIQSYLNTGKAPTNKRFKTRISNWFDMTERYHKQLYEMDKKDYLEYKNKERLDQIRLQKLIADTENGSNTIPVSEITCMANGETKKGPETLPLWE